MHETLVVGWSPDQPNRPTVRSPPRLLDMILEAHDRIAGRRSRIEEETFGRAGGLVGRPAHSTADAADWYDLAPTQLIRIRVDGSLKRTRERRRGFGYLSPRSLRHVHIH